MVKIHSQIKIKSRKMKKKNILFIFLFLIASASTMFFQGLVSGLTYDPGNIDSVFSYVPPVVTILLLLGVYTSASIAILAYPPRSNHLVLFHQRTLILLLALSMGIALVAGYESEGLQSRIRLVFTPELIFLTVSVVNFAYFYYLRAIYAD
jgi:hypothetical protein